MAEDEAEPVRRRHARHFAALVDEFAPVLHARGQAGALQRLRADCPNLSAAFATLAAAEALDAALRFVKATGDYAWTREARHLAVSRAELGETAAATDLLTSAFDAVGAAFDDRELRRMLAASALVLVRIGEPELAARAVGAAGGVQDLFADYLAIARGRLAGALGADRLASLEVDGAGLPLATVIAGVRERLAAGDAVGPACAAQAAPGA